jgi:hypothetical protein
MNVRTDYLDQSKCAPDMNDELHEDSFAKLRSAAMSEMEYIRQLGNNDDLRMATANLGAFEAILYIIAEQERGVPVYNAISNVKSRYAGQSGILVRLRAMRELGLLEERAGAKKSQVCLFPSSRLITQLGPILLEKAKAKP